MGPGQQGQDFGVMPGAPGTAPVKVRSELSGGNIFGQWAMTLLMGMGCGGAFFALGLLTASIAIKAAEPRDQIFWIGPPFFWIISAVFIGMAIHVARRTNRWVELDGDIIRAQNLYTGKVIERSVPEITEVGTEIFAVANTAIHITEALQGRVRGFAIRFADLPQGIRVYRPEMQNVEALIEAVTARMQAYGEVEPEIIQFEGKPLVRRIKWVEGPPSIRNKVVY